MGGGFAEGKKHHASGLTSHLRIAQTNDNVHTFLRLCKWQNVGSRNDDKDEQCSNYVYTKSRQYRGHAIDYPTDSRVLIHQMLLNPCHD